MNWKVKALIQKTIGFLPFSNKVNYFFQKNITKKLPVPEWMFEAMVKEADHHFSELVKHQKCFDDISEVKHYEFGSGWDMIVPLAYYNFGVKTQNLIDLNYLIKPDLIKSTFQRLQAYQDTALQNKLQHKETVWVEKDFLQQFGIKYNAPKDARTTEFLENSFHFSSSTNVLEHVPKKDILPILKETYRVLKKGGVFTFRIDYSDHYSYFDNSISIYNFLQFSDKEWLKYDHSLQPQTRIRHSEMIDNIRKTNFEIVNTTKHTPSEKELSTLKTLKLAPQFESFKAEDLAIGWAYITLRKN